MSEMWKLFVYTYFVEKSPDIILVVGESKRYLIHREMFYQTKKMFDMLCLAESKTNVGEQIQIGVPAIDEKHLGYVMFYLYNGEIDPRDKQYACLEILVDVFGFPQIIYNFDPEVSKVPETSTVPELKSSETAKGERICILSYLRSSTHISFL